MNEWCLWELSREGIKVGDIIEGVYNPETGTVYLDRGIAYVGATCEIVKPRRMDTPQLINELPEELIRKGEQLREAILNGNVK